MRRKRSAADSYNVTERRGKTVPSRTLGLAVTAGLVAVAALVGGAILFTSSRASEVNLTTASLVPEDAGIYFALNTDLSSSEWVNTFRLVERLGQGDPEEALKDGVDDAGVDWEEEVAPFLGGNAAIFVRGISIEDISAQGAVIVRCKDAKAALEVIDDQVGLGDDTEHGDIEYFETFGGFVAIIGDHLVIAFDEDSMEAVIDVHTGKIKSLSSRDDFQRLRDELTGNFLGFVYLSADSLAGDFFLDDPEVRDALERSGAGDLVFEPAAWVIGAKADGFEFQAASLGKGGPVSPMLVPRESRLVRYVPADAAIYLSTTDIAGTWDRVMTSARPEIDRAIRSEGDYDSLDDALREAGREIGIQSIEDLIELLNGETSFAFWFPKGSEEDAEGVMLAEVDQGRAEALLKQISATSAWGTPQTKKVNGKDMTWFKDQDGDETAYAFLDGNLVLGTRAGVEKVLGNNEPPLSSLNRYNRTVEQMPSKLGSYGYFDLSKLLRLAEGGIPADLDEVERALSGLIINVVDERGIVRLSGILTIEE
jgi:hypothetical protein